MLQDLLIEMVTCTRCSFSGKDYPPLAPVRLAEHVKIMFVGENPSWEFGQRVPFDGITNSGRALHDNYLVPLKKSYRLKESDFWITDLFKCRYPKEVHGRKVSQRELISNNAKICATHWLRQEVLSTQPAVIITLGDKEVYQRLRATFSVASPPLFADAAYKLHDIDIAGHRCKLLPACHPDISFDNSRKPTPSRKWSKLHHAHFVNSLAGALARGVA